MSRDKKGQFTGGNSGRKKGSKNKKSLASKETLEAMFHDKIGFEKLFETIEEMEFPKDKLNGMIKIMEFFMAKQKEIEVKGDLMNETVKVTFTSSQIKPITAESELFDDD